MRTLSFSWGLHGDDEVLLEEPYPPASLTSPAVHADGVQQYLPGRAGKIGIEG